MSFGETVLDALREIKALKKKQHDLGSHSLCMKGLNKANLNVAIYWEETEALSGDQINVFQCRAYAELKPLTFPISSWSITGRRETNRSENMNTTDTAPYLLISHTDWNPLIEWNWHSSELRISRKLLVFYLNASILFIFSSLYIFIFYVLSCLIITTYSSTKLIPC